ncbi:hypothetical protein QTP86_009270 [Hemibagrus guttatus]|nr:hypothetical protein QTP86_009270 [Hemibagrus guttatus]
MWVCNLCRKQQEILTKSGEWFSSGPRGRPLSVAGPEADRDGKLRSRSQAATGANPDSANDAQPATDRTKGADIMPISRARSEPPREKKRPVSLHEQNGKVIIRGERRMGFGRQPGQVSEERAPGERRESRRLEKGHSQEYDHAGDTAHLDQKRRKEEEERDRERQRREEEYQNRYCSDPNLARYPVKPQKEEQEMRMHAKVSKMRQERHHSDMAINEVGLAQDGCETPGTRLSRRVPGNENRKALMENQRAYSVDRTVGGSAGGGPVHLQKQGHSGSHMSPGGSQDLRDGQDWGHKGYLEPGSAALLHKTKREKAAESFRKDSSLSSDQSENLRPPPPRAYRPKRGLNKRQMSISSSEEEGGSTPEYTSCEDVEIESISEKGDWDCHPLDPTVWHVVGGKITETGRLGAFITKVKKGSLADVVGHLRAGDEVLQWNGKALPGATKKEVYNIILESQSAPQVEIVVSRPIGDKSKRRTKTVKKSSEPRWNQTFLYSHVHRRDFRERMLEITVWDQPRAQEEESEFLGEILIELETALLDDQPHWYKLQTHDVSSLPLPQPSPYLPRRHVHTDSPSKKLQRSHRIIETDYDDAITVVSSAAERNSRERERCSTLTVPERQAAIQHRSRSVSPHREDKSLDEIRQKRHHSQSPTHYYNNPQQEHRSGDSDYDYSEDSDLQPSLDRVRSASTTCLRPESSFRSPDRDRLSDSLDRPVCEKPNKKSIENDRIQPTSILRGSRWRKDGPIRPFGQSSQDRAHGGRNSPTEPPLSVRRGRQLPQLPAKSSSIEQALAVEERARQLSQMRVPSYRPGSSASSGHEQDMDLKNKRDVKIIGELQRGGKKGEEDLMGGERAGAEEEPGKEALLRGAETPAPHCGWRCEFPHKKKERKKKKLHSFSSNFKCLARFLL